VQVDNTIATPASLPSAGGKSKTRKQATLAWLKRSHFLAGMAKALRGLIRDTRVVFWMSRRNHIAEGYFKTHTTKKLQLGASNNIIPGWLNTDVCLNHHRSVFYLDATKRFPFSDNTFDYIMSEHMIEHVPYPDAQNMLRECYRVLRPGGRVRFATPDLQVLLALHNREKTEAQKHYIDWSATRFMPDIQHCKEVFVINNFFHAWGHCFLYDQETLCQALHAAGFNGVKFYKPGVSEDPNLKDLESHGIEIQSEQVNQFETIVVEGCKERSGGT
jgi:predicted SAM-dependent methyltransferase